MKQAEMQAKSDEEIVKIVQNGDVEAFGLLVNRFEKKMLRYAKKFLFDATEAEDLVQEVFLKAYTNIQSFDTKKPFSPWLYRIAHNTYINAGKKKKNEPLGFFDFDFLSTFFSRGKNVEENIKEEEIKEMVNKCLFELDKKYREVIVLYFLEEMDYKAISDILHIPTSTVGVRLSRGKQKLKKIYLDKYGKK